MTLRWHPEADAFTLETRDVQLRQRAYRAGLSQTPRGTIANGAPTFFTKSVYEALSFIDVATPEAHAQLDGVMWQEEASRTRYPVTIPPPTPPDRDLMPFQHAGLEYILDRAHTIVGDEMGLGKTIEAIVAANAWGSKKVLVICPANLRLNWQNEIRVWTTKKGVNVDVVRKAAQGVSEYADWVVISYDLARNKVVNEVLRGLKWDLIILDECHYMKNAAAGRTKMVLGSWASKGQSGYEEGLLNNAPHILAMTGTLLPNRPKECYTIIRAICWEAIDWMSFREFMKRYAPEITYNNGHLEERTRHLGELQMRLRCYAMLRRLKKNVLDDFPEKMYELSYIEPNGEINKALKAEKLLDINIDDLDMSAMMEGHISTVRRLMGEAKVPRVIEHMTTLLDGGVEKVILFAHHRVVIDDLTAALSKYGLVRIDGRTGINARQEAVNRFQKDPSVRIFLGQMTAAGEGITLTAASHVVFAEPSWTPKDNEQCIDRAHRIGQKDTVLAQFLVVQGSLDERIIGKAISKAEAIFETLDKRGNTK